MKNRNLRKKLKSYQALLDATTDYEEALFLDSKMTELKNELAARYAALKN